MAWLTFYIIYGILIPDESTNKDLKENIMLMKFLFVVHYPILGILALFNMSYDDLIKYLIPTLIVCVAGAVVGYIYSNSYKERHIE